LPFGGVGSGRAGDLVGRAVADEVDSRGPEERVVLDEGRPRRQRHGRADLVRSAARALDDLVGEVVDEVGVVAAAAGHRVRARLAVERVVPGIAGKAVGAALPVPARAAIPVNTRFSSSAPST
jgi:hypothetical protein